MGSETKRTLLGKPTSPGDAAGLLLECHERIRSFLALSRRIAESAPSEEHAALADAATRVHRYFTEALPLHARDEEESVLPRLLGKSPTLDAELSVMAREHADHERPLARLAEACQALAGEPSHRAELVATIANATADLERQFAGHLRREEEVIFPALRQLLERAADQEIVAEIRARRQPRDQGPAHSS